MLISNEWKDYELLDAANGEKLERWGKYILQRPDGQVIWPSLNNKSWDSVDAVYHRSDKGGGSWEQKTALPERWIIEYKKLSFYVEPTGFKHTGIFPEQAVNWDWMMNKILKEQRSYNKEIKVLNLFAYTGAASIACALAGASVVQVDSSKGINQWAKENYELNLQKNKLNSVRFITDDVKKFVQREIRRGNKYDGIIMDPPVYGRGPNGELWEIEKEISSLVKDCVSLLSSNPLFFLINSYTASFSHLALSNLLDILIKTQFNGTVDSGEIGLETGTSLPFNSTHDSKRILPCGIYGKWEA